jgi:hypothetical protein
MTRPQSSSDRRIEKVLRMIDVADRPPSPMMPV